MFGDIIGAAMGAQAGAVIPMRSQHELQCMQAQMNLEQQMLRAQQQQQSYAAYQQQLSGLAGLVGPAMLASAWGACGATKRRVTCSPRTKHRRRLWMRMTKAGYRARARAEAILWTALAIIVGGGVLVPLGCKVYTAFWTWALT
jgi:hypothetical protein